MNEDDSGILSIDFVAGFTIFLIALIIVINMIPGLLLSVQSASVDYDAVAYRTSVILTEDPGWPYDPAWELEDSDHKDDIERLGLAVSKYTPNILSTEKINKFFSKSTEFNFTYDEYKNKAVFGDFQYRFNISLLEDSSSPLYAGEPVPDLRYGYMRRLVKIKHYSSADYMSGDYNTTPVEVLAPLPPYSYDNGISFSLKYSELIDKSMSPAYRIDPKNEPVIFRINNFSESVINATAVKLRQTRFIKNGVEVPMPYGVFDNSTYLFSVDGTYHTMNDEIDMSDKSQIEFRLYPTLMFSSEVTSVLNLTFSFSYEFAENGTNYPVSGDLNYCYGCPEVNEPYLTDGVMEVCIW